MAVSESTQLTRPSWEGPKEISRASSSDFAWESSSILQRKTATNIVMNKLSCFYGLGVYWGDKDTTFSADSIRLLPTGGYSPGRLPDGWLLQGAYRRA